MSNLKFRLERACDAHAASHAGHRVVLGIALILLGSFFILVQTGHIAGVSAVHAWPIVFCIFGANRLLFGGYALSRIKGAIQIFLGVWIWTCLEHLWGLTFSNSWPVILIAVGLCYIFAFVFKDPRHFPERES